MKKFVIIIKYSENKREIRYGNNIYYLFLKLRFLFTKVEISKI